MAVINFDSKKPSSSAQNGISKEQFEVLFSDFYPKLLAYAVSILNDKQVAEDIVQEVFLYVWENRGKICFGDGVLSYLFQSTYTRCIDNIKKDKHYEEYVRQALHDLSKEYYCFLQSDSQIIRKLFSTDFQRELDLLLSKLPETRRKVFELVYIQGLRTKEISETLQIPQRTVESHVYLTMKYLRENLKATDYLFLISIFYLF